MKTERMATQIYGIRWVTCKKRCKKQETTKASTIGRLLLLFKAV